MEIPGTKFLVVFEPGQSGLWNADDFALKADVAVLSEGHLKVLEKLWRLEVFRDDDFDNAEAAERLLLPAVQDYLPGALVFRAGIGDVQEVLPVLFTADYVLGKADVSAVLAPDIGELERCRYLAEREACMYSNYPTPPRIARSVPVR